MKVFLSISLYFLKGMLIYVPATSRAGIAVLICIICIANLNFFEPHKNRVLFWLSQISFITTASKYTVALLIASSVKKQELKLIGTLLIGLDVFFMISSILVIVVSLLMCDQKLLRLIKDQKKCTVWLKCNRIMVKIGVWLLRISSFWKKLIQKTCKKHVSCSIR